MLLKYHTLILVSWETSIHMDLLLAANVKSQGVFNWASFVNIEQKYIVWWKQMTVSTSSSLTTFCNMRCVCNVAMSCKSIVYAHTVGEVQCWFDDVALFIPFCSAWYTSWHLMSWNVHMPARTFWIIKFLLLIFHFYKQKYTIVIDGK